MRRERTRRAVNESALKAPKAAGVDPVSWTPDCVTTFHEVCPMARTSRFSREFREEATRLARLPGHTLRSVGADLGVSHETIRRWVEQFEAQASPRERAALDDHTEVVALRRRVRVLEEEREILVKASAFLARETRRGA
jgi:transposase